MIERARTDNSAFKNTVWYFHALIQFFLTAQTQNPATTKRVSPNTTFFAM
jgi:hypothetical protein